MNADKEFRKDEWFKRSLRLSELKPSGFVFCSNINRKYFKALKE